MSDSERIENDEIYIELTDRYGNLPEMVKYAYEEDKIEIMLNRLKEIIEHSQNEIDVVCRYDNAAILDCLNSVDQLASSYFDVKEACIKLNEKVDTVFVEYDNSVRILQRYQTVQRNVAIVLDYLIKCLPAISIDNILDQPIISNNYLLLLDACDKLELMKNNIQIHELTFIKRIFDTIPKIRDNIKQHVTESLKNFLNSSLEQFPIIGVKYWIKALKYTNTIISTEQAQTYETLLLHDDTPLFYNVDFIPLFWYSKIIDRLNNINDDELNFYIIQRKKQFGLIFNQNEKINSSKALEYHLENMFYHIIGFFAFEHYIQCNIYNLINKNYLIIAYQTLTNYILIYLSTIIKNIQHFNHIKNIKLVLAQFDRVLETLGIESDISSRSIKVFSEIFIKIMGEEFKEINENYDINDHFIEFKFDNFQQEYEILSYFSIKSISESSYPKNISLPKYFYDIILNYLKIAGSHSKLSDYDRIDKFQFTISFFDIAIRQLITYFDKFSSDSNQIIICYYNACFIHDYFNKLTSAHASNKECLHEIDHFNASSLTLIKKIKDIILDQIFDHIFDAFDHFKPDYNPAIEIKETSQSFDVLITFLSDYFSKLSLYQSFIYNEILLIITSKIAQDFITYLTITSYDSCNKNFLRFIYNTSNSVKLILLEYSHQSLHAKIESDFYQLKQIINLVLLDDWSNFFDNYALSFSPYNQIQLDILIKLTSKLAVSYNPNTIGNKFSKLFSKVKFDEIDYQEITATLLKLYHKNS